MTDTNAKTQNFKLAKSFTEWFDETGQFVAVPFQEILATNVPLIGQRDQKRVKSASEDLLHADPDVLDAILAANSAEPEGSSTAAEAPAKKGGKRRKV